MIWTVCAGFRALSYNCAHAHTPGAPGQFNSIDCRGCGSAASGGVSP
jgi:hypothetical protein